MSGNPLRKTINHRHYSLRLNTDIKAKAEKEEKELKKCGFTVKIMKNTRNYGYKYDVWILGRSMPIY